MSLPYPPPWMDLRTLSEHICLSDTTIEAHVKKGEFPAPVMQGGKRLWEWKKVQKHLGKPAGDGPPSPRTPEEVKNATKKATQDA